MSTAPRNNPTRTYSIPADEGTMRRLRRLLSALESTGDASGISLVTSDGMRHELPVPLARALHDVTVEMVEGHDVVVEPRHRLLTTQGAAELLQVSRPTVVKLLDRGDLPVVMRGSHRRVRLEDVLAFDHRQREDRARALEEMQAGSQSNGVYVLDGDAPVRR